jgi:hypothetical protein
MQHAVKRSVWLLALTAAQELKKEGEAFQQRLFGHALDKKPIHVCFTRVYDAAHLAQHPQQNVRAMLLLVRGNAELQAQGWAYLRP